MNDHLCFLADCPSSRICCYLATGQRSKLPNIPSFSSVDRPIVGGYPCFAFAPSDACSFCKGNQLIWKSGTGKKDLGLRAMAAEVGCGQRLRDVMSVTDSFAGLLQDEVVGGFPDAPKSLRRSNFMFDYPSLINPQRLSAQHFRHSGSAVRRRCCNCPIP